MSGGGGGKYNVFKPHHLHAVRHTAFVLEASNQEASRKSRRIIRKIGGIKSNEMLFSVGWLTLWGSISLKHVWTKKIWPSKLCLTIIFPDMFTSTTWFICQDSSIPECISISLLNCREVTFCFLYCERSNDFKLVGTTSTVPGQNKISNACDLNIYLWPGNPQHAAFPGIKKGCHYFRKPIWCLAFVF